MVKQGRAPKHVSPSGVELLGTADTLAAYSDVFVVAQEGETGMGSIYFYQRQLSDRGAILGTTDAGVVASKAKCIARILMAPTGIERLLEALAENRGFTITRKG